MTQVTINGNTYSDAGESAKDMRSGGHRAYLLPLLGDTMAVVGQAAINTASAQAAAIQAQAAQALAQAAQAGIIAVSLNVPTGLPACRPALLLNFAKTRRLDPRMTFSRASSALFTDANGFLATAAANAARFDHDSITGECLGLLIEEQRANLLLYSDQFNNAAWLMDNVSTPSVAAISPDGTLNAYKLAENTAVAPHSLYQAAGMGQAGAVATASIYVKAAERTKFRLYFDAIGGGQVLGGVVDLSAGTVAAGSAASGGVLLKQSVTALKNGWFRVTVTGYIAGKSTYFTHAQCIDPSGAGAYEGSFGSGLYIFKAQIELGEFATSQIATTSAAVTRPVDYAAMTGTGFSSWFQPEEGTFILGYGAAMSASSMLDSQSLMVSDGSGNNAYVLRFYSFNNVNTFDAIVVSGGAGQMDSEGLALAASASAAVQAFGYKVNNIASVINGGAVAVDTVNALPVGVDWLRLGGGGMVQTIAYLAYYRKRLANSELQIMSNL